MKKLFLPTLALVVVGALIISVSSCQQDVSDRFEYNVDSDSIPPVIAISVPAMNQTYTFGNHVAIVGTVTDLESEKNDIHNPGFRKGELKSLTIEVINKTTSQTLFKRTPSVIGVDGYAINERFELLSGSGNTDCELIITVTDAKNKTAQETIDFVYQ